MLYNDIMKKIEKEELNEVNGGVSGDDYFSANCNACGELMICNMLNRRIVGNGCDSKEEYQCPNCGNWNNYF